MSKYTLTIEGDFEKYECNKCPLGILSVSGFVCVMDDGISCPLEEVKRSEWVISSDGYYPYCKNCNYRPKDDLTNFCPNCGADMRGGKE